MKHIPPAPPKKHPAKAIWWRAAGGTSSGCRGCCPCPRGVKSFAVEHCDLWPPFTLPSLPVDRRVTSSTVNWKKKCYVSFPLNGVVVNIRPSLVSSASSEGVRLDPPCAKKTREKKVAFKQTSPLPFTVEKKTSLYVYCCRIFLENKKRVKTLWCLDPFPWGELDCRPRNLKQRCLSGAADEAVVETFMNESSRFSCFNVVFSFSSGSNGCWICKYSKLDRQNQQLLTIHQVLFQPNVTSDVFSELLVKLHERNKECHSRH